MLRYLLILVAFSFVSIHNSAHADAFVCVDANGKKMFSSEACSKRGMKTATNEFPVVAGQAMTAKIILPPSDNAPKLAKDGGMISPDGKYVTKPGQIYMSGELPLEKPVLYFLVIMMAGAAALFGLIFMRFFKAHHSKYTHE
jgi:hypothetical protein